MAEHDYQSDAHQDGRYQADITHYTNALRRYAKLLVAESARKYPRPERIKSYKAEVAKFKAYLAERKAA